jgi:hypothetical protein
MRARCAKHFLIGQFGAHGAGKGDAARIPARDHAIGDGHQPPAIGDEQVVEKMDCARAVVLHQVVDFGQNHLGGKARNEPHIFLLEQKRQA